jgi:quercetin dioxygenase-like cupin family protein
MTMQAPPLTATTVRLDVFGNLLSFRLRAAQTDGAFSMIDCETLPGAGTPPHIQSDAEAFLVLDGTYEFMVDGAVQQAGPGSVVNVPPGAPHAFRNPGDAPARMLILNWPGGQHEGFFDAVGTPVPAGATPVPAAPDMGRVFAAAAAHGITILPPE